MNAEFEQAQAVDDELFAEEEAMLADPAPYEAEVAADPVAAYEELQESRAMEFDNQLNFDADFRSEEAVDRAITDL